MVGEEDSLGAYLSSNEAADRPADPAVLTVERGINRDALQSPLPKRKVIRI